MEEDEEEEEVASASEGEEEEEFVDPFYMEWRVDRMLRSVCYLSKGRYAYI